MFIDGQFTSALSVLVLSEGVENRLRSGGASTDLEGEDHGFWMKRHRILDE
jgi:hypothetical protein